MVRTFRKLPVFVDAMKFDGTDDSARALKEWGCEIVWRTWFDDGKFRINTLEGDMILSPHDWVIKGVKGEFYPCKPDIFSLTYEEVR